MLKALVFGDIGSLVCFVSIFGLDGFFRLFWVWFGYFAYASADFRAVRLNQILACIFLCCELGLLVSQQESEHILRHNITKFTYYILLIWEVFKISICNKIYHVFREAAQRYNPENSALVDGFAQADIETQSSSEDLIVVQQDGGYERVIH